jgi:hypothetical protein
MPRGHVASARFIELNGRYQRLSEWCREYGVSFSTVCNRLKRGWPILKALETPVRQGRYRRRVDAE